MDIKINQIRLRKNLATKWGVEGYLYSGHIEDLHSINVGDQDLDHIGLVLTIDADGKPVWRTPGNMLRLLPDHDSWADRNQPGYNHGGSTTLHIAHGIYNGIIDELTFMHFPVDSVPEGKVISTAVLYLYRISDSGDDEGLNPIFRNAATFDEDTLTWNNKPSKTGDLVANLFLPSYQSGWVHVDITELFKGWYSGSITNYGIQIEPASEYGYVYWSESFDSKDCYTPATRPYILITAL